MKHKWMAVRIMLPNRSFVLDFLMSLHFQWNNMLYFETLVQHQDILQLGCILLLRIFTLASQRDLLKNVTITTSLVQLYLRRCCSTGMETSRRCPVPLRTPRLPGWTPAAHSMWVSALLRYLQRSRSHPRVLEHYLALQVAYLICRRWLLS